MESIKALYKRKRRFRFNLDHDVALMKQVREFNPFASENSHSAKRLWEIIALNLQTSTLRMNVTSRACRLRAIHLLGNLDKERTLEGFTSAASIRANEVEQLLELEENSNSTNLTPQHTTKLKLEPENHHIDDSSIFETEKSEWMAEHEQIDNDNHPNDSVSEEVLSDPDPFSKINLTLKQLCSRVDKMERLFSVLLCWTKKQDGISERILEGLKRVDQGNYQIQFVAADQQCNNDVNNPSDDMPLIKTEEDDEFFAEKETPDFSNVQEDSSVNMSETHSMTAESETFFCEMCGKSYKTKGNLRTHQKENHIESQKYVCETCGKSFSRKLRLRNHTMIHSDARNFKCEYCNATFRSRVGQRIHEKRHFGVKAQAQCTKCGQKFITNANLRRHVERVHDKIRRYLCSICAKPFKTSEHLKYHIKTHSNPNSKKRGLNRDSDSTRIKRKGGIRLVKQIIIPKSEPEQLQISSVNETTAINT